MDAARYIQQLMDYGQMQYDHMMDKIYKECPYNVDHKTDDLAYKHVMTWAVFEKKDSSGLTTVDKFVKEFIDDPDVAAQLLQLKDVTNDTFYVKKKADSNNVLQAVSLSDGTKYNIEVKSIGLKKCKKGYCFMGCIHPWYSNGTYQTCGIVDIIPRALDIPLPPWVPNGDIGSVVRFMAHDFLKSDSIPIPKQPRLAPMLKKLSGEWISDICIMLKLEPDLYIATDIQKIHRLLTTMNSLRHIVLGLGKNERAALRLVLLQDGIIDYCTLCDKVGKDDTAYSFLQRPMPRSVVGLLRRYGLLIVGSKKIDKKLQKMAIIPIDVAQLLPHCLGMVADDDPPV